MEREQWRDVLATFIKSADERKALADMLGINPLTVWRWIESESEIQPRPRTIFRLLEILPAQQRDQLMAVLPADLRPSTQPRPRVESPSLRIPSPFYENILNMHSTLSPNVRRMTICDQILTQTLKQLDPDREGVEISVVQCMPPRDGYVRSLREIAGRGTALWQRELEQRTMFLGAESLTGYVLTTGRPRSVQSRDQRNKWFLTQWMEHEQSAAVYPILRGERTAGCLVVSCRLTGFLESPQLDLLEQTAHLVTLAFDPSEFYELSRIQLKLMPPYELQKSELMGFRQRVSTIMKNRQLPLYKAEEEVWGELEERFFHLALPFQSQALS